MGNRPKLRICLVRLVGGAYSAQALARDTVPAFAGADDMPQPTDGCAPNAKSELMQLHPIGVRSEGHSRAALAVNDARNLIAALTANLDFVSGAITNDKLEEGARQHLRDTVEVCRQLAQLLGGAIGICREASRTVAPAISVNSLTPIVEGALERIANHADENGILVVAEGPRSLRVSVDQQMLMGALELLLHELVSGAPKEGVVRLGYRHSGAHAVIGVTTQGNGPIRLNPVSSSQGFAGGAVGFPPRFSEVIASLSLMLLEQGGYVDLEPGTDGTLTVYLVVPAVPEISDDSAQSGTGFAQRSSIERGGDPATGQKRSETMIVNSDRFGAIEVDTEDLLSFPTGIIGFPKENQFLLVRKTDSQVVGWLQSVRTSYLTLPVVSAHALAAKYPDVPIEEFAERAGLGNDLEELAVLGVLSAPPGQPATVNLMAPIIVNAVTRVGAQVLLEGTRFTTRELFIIPPTPAVETERNGAPSETQPIQTATSAAE